VSEIADFLRARYTEDGAAIRANWNASGITSQRYQGTPIDPTRLLADLDAKLALIDDLLAEGHQTVDDEWYTCPAVVDQQLGFESGRGGPCGCGRDRRVNRRLAILALPYAGYPDYRNEWAP
jgi:hypothetical protein